MARRHKGNMKGEQYLANTNPSKREVDDLDREDTAGTGWQIDEIIRAGNDRPYNSLTAAKAAGFDNCAKCLGGPGR